MTGPLLANNINVLQGQLDGHCSHLMSMLTSRDMSGFVCSTLRAIRHRHLPELEQYHLSIYSHTMFQEKVCLKDSVLHNVTITPGYLAECRDATEPLTKAFDPRDPDNVIFTQIVFAPLDSGQPGNPSTRGEFEHYLSDLKRVTDAVKHG